MKILIRGIPTFSYLSSIEVEDIEEFLSRFSLRVSCKYDGTYSSNYYNADGKRVLLYIQSVLENSNALQARSFDPKFSNSMRTMYVEMREPGRLSSAGSDSLIRPSEDRFYIIDPVNDTRYPAALAEAKVQARIERARISALEEAQREEHEYRLSLLGDAVERLGHRKIVEILKTL